MTRSYEQMLRDADPYRPGTGGAADEELLAQILAEPRGKRPTHRLAMVGVAAGVLIAAVGIAAPLAWNQPPAAPPASVAPSMPGPPAQPESLLEPQKVRKAAEEGPRLVIGEPGWKIIHLEPFGDHMGEMAWEKGDRMLNSSWFPEPEYTHRRQDKQKGAEKVTVGGLTGWMVANGRTDFLVMTEPRDGDGVFASLNSGSGWTRAQFRAFLASMRTVDVAAWTVAASADVTRSGEAGDRTYRLFAEGGLPHPPNWDDAVLDRLPAANTFEFDTALAKQVACDWLTEWQRAGAEGRTDARKAARTALLTSNEWPVLQDLERQGSDLRRTITTMATAVAGGQAGTAEVNEYRRNLC